jgi:hypothetical protein
VEWGHILDRVCDDQGFRPSEYSVKADCRKHERGPGQARDEERLVDLEDRNARAREQPRCRYRPGLDEFEPGREPIIDVVALCPINDCRRLEFACTLEMGRADLVIEARMI